MGNVSASSTVLIDADPLPCSMQSPTIRACDRRFFVAAATANIGCFRVARQGKPSRAGSCRPPTAGTEGAGRC